MKGECSKNECSTGCSCSICWCKISIAFGLSNAIFVLIIGLLGTFYGCCLLRIEQLGVMYPGFSPTLSGSFLGAFWAFLCAFLFFRVAGWIYTVLSSRCKKCCCNQMGCCKKSSSDAETKK